MSAETGMFHPLTQSKASLATILGFIALASTMGLFQVGPGVPPVDPTGRIIDRIEFEGLETIDPIYLQGVAGIRAGAVWNRDEVAEACRRIAATQKFEGVPFGEPREDEGKLVLVFVVAERPFVTGVDFVGNVEFSAGDLLKEIDLEVGSPISAFLTRQATEKIEQKYQEAGYAHATVEVDGEVLKVERRVLFRVSEGPRVKVREIVFEGNLAFSDLRLKSKIETATYLWIFRTGRFDPETAQRDAAAIKSFYVARGYLNAQVGYRVETGKTDADLNVIFQIDEGLCHIIESVEFSGNVAFDEGRLNGMMKANVGAVADADVLKADREAILAGYGELGYIYAEIATGLAFSEEDGFVHLSVSINEGDQYRFGRIVVRGNERTKDKVIRRELRFYPEALYDTQAAKRAEQRLTETRLFDEVSITPEGADPGVRNALVSVEEADTTTILFGVGVTSNSGVVGSISIEQRNFDLFDWPRTFKEFYTGRALRGAGQTMRLNLEPGTELTRGRLSFREPYLMDKEVGFGTSLYLFERGRDDYDERRVGFNFSFDKRWREGLLKDWSGEVAFRFEGIKVSGTDWLTAPEILDDAGSTWLTSVKGTIIRDKTDSIWLPSEGNSLKLSIEQAGALGGDHVFTKTMATYDRYWTLKTDNFGRKHVFQVGATAGGIFGDAPVFEKFYAGGIGSIRGFEFRGISPRSGFHDQKIGGDFLLLANSQYSFPLVGKTVRGVTFLDMGTVEEDFGINSWRASVGVGARIYIKYFGPIPLSFDLAFPIGSDSEDDTQVFSFSFGTTF